MSLFSNDLRPKTIKDILGQSHLTNFLSKVVSQKEHVSLILYGPPGIGKTSLAYALCNDLKVTYSYFNASKNNKKDLEEMIKISDYLIVDEFHRLNKDKQDLLLPNLEFGKIKIIATTTENPFFVINPAVRSRMHILELKNLSVLDLTKAMEKVIKNNKIEIDITKKFLQQIALNANGDYRYCLNILNLLLKLYPNEKITTKILKNIMPSIHFYFDKKGDNHYDLLSAFHKSLRGSDVQASLYYLALLIKSGDILGIERRLLACTYEDVGLASPNLPLRVFTAIESAKKLGFPEARLPLSNIVIEIAKAAKSNSALLAIDKAITQIEKQVFEIPLHLKDAHYKSASKLKRGVSYIYTHDFPEVKQEFLPKELQRTIFYKKNQKDKI